MKYILNPHIALRSWWLVPYAYYRKGERNARGLKKEEYDLLSLCDGTHEIEESALFISLLERGFVSPVKEGQNLSKWQKKICDNRYFPAMNWMITGKCNYNCLHCFNASDNSPLMSEFSFEEANKLLDEAEFCGINAFTITGGEPMCHKHFFEIIEGIYERNMFVEELNTNGFYITQEALDRFKKIGCNPLIKISLDGLGHHDWLRNRKGAQENALQAIRLCIENGFDVKVQTNVHRWNVESMVPTARLLDEMGVEEMRMIRTTEVPRWNENAKGATLGLNEYFDCMTEFVKTYTSESHKMIIDIWQFMTLFPSDKSYQFRAIECGIGEYRDSLPVCRGNRGMVAVGANGNVFPCLQLSGTYEARNEFLGNVKTDGLQPLLQRGAYLSEVCTTVKELAEKNKKCGTCKYFKHCVGGCRALGFALTGNKLGEDISKCAFFEGGYYEKLEEILEGWYNNFPMEK